ncbi:hypothetical protein RFI_32223, partial [Reticulomyxa filosa]
VLNQTRTHAHACIRLLFFFFFFCFFFFFFFFFEFKNEAFSSLSFVFVLMLFLFLFLAAQLEEELSKSNERYLSLRTETDKVKSSYDGIVESLKEQLQSAETKLANSKLEFDKKVMDTQLSNKIAQKKHNQMLKELQTQLKNEVVKSQELKCQLLKLEDELRHAKTTGQRPHDLNPSNDKGQISSSSSSSTATITTVATSIANTVTATTPSSFSSASSSPPSNKPLPPKNSKAGPPASQDIELEVSQAIAKKLEKGFLYHILYFPKSLKGIMNDKGAKGTKNYFD